MEIWIPVLVAALSSSVLVGLLQILAEPLRLKWQHRWNLEASREEASFADTRRRLEAHLDARDRFLAEGEAVRRWADNMATAVLGPDVDYFDPEGTPSLDDLKRKGLPASLKALRHVHAMHPTRAVRSVARATDESLRSFYGDINKHMGSDTFPEISDKDELLDFIRKAESLVELLHEPSDMKALA